MSNNIKTAQFGGVGGGGQASPFTPGKKPMGVGQGARGINNYIDEDMSFEKILSKTHMDPEPSDKNLESRISIFHKQNPEQDAANYILDSSERLRAKYKAILHNYKQTLEIEAESIIKNSPKYIKEHMSVKEKHMMTREESLQSRRKYNKDTKYPREQYTDPDKPSRLHFAISDQDINRIAEGHAIGRRNRIQKEYPQDERSQFDTAVYDRWPEMSYKQIELKDGWQGLTDYLEDSSKANRDYAADTWNEPVLDDYKSPDGKANVHPRKDIAEVPEDSVLNEIDLFQGLESNLRKNEEDSTYADKKDFHKNTIDGLEDIYPIYFYGNSGHSF
jgi:hypothetical protein